jgi:hypothetical protein
MKRILPLTLLAATFATAAAAQDAAPSAPPPACLRFGEIYSWKALDNRTVIAEDIRHNKFSLALMGYCPDVKFKERIGFQSPGSSYLSCMSAGDTLLVNQFGTGRPQRCPISGITAYTPQMEAADKAKASGGQ